jgi:hypothetical protein
VCQIIFPNNPHLPEDPKGLRFVLNNLSTNDCNNFILDNGPERWQDLGRFRI